MKGKRRIHVAYDFLIDMMKASPDAWYLGRHPLPDDAKVVGHIPSDSHYFDIIVESEEWLPFGSGEIIPYLDHDPVFCRLYNAASLVRDDS